MQKVEKSSIFIISTNKKQNGYEIRINSMSKNLTNFKFKTLRDRVSKLYCKPELKEQKDETMLLNITDEEIDRICRDVFNEKISTPLKTVLLDRAVNILFAMINANMVTYKRPNTYFIGVEFTPMDKSFTHTIAYGTKAYTISNYHPLTRESFILKENGIIETLITFDLLKLLKRDFNDVFRNFSNSEGENAAIDFENEVGELEQILNSFLLTNKEKYLKYIITTDDFKLSNKAKTKMLLEIMEMLNTNLSDQETIDNLLLNSELKPLPKQVLKINVLDFKNDFIVADIYAIVKAVIKELNDPNAHYWIISDSLADIDTTVRTIINTLYTIINGDLKKYKE